MVRCGGSRSFRGRAVLACVASPVSPVAPSSGGDFRGIPRRLPVGARPSSLWEGGATVRPSRGLSPKPRSPPGGSGVQDLVRHKHQAMMPSAPSQGFAPPHLLVIPAEEAGTLSPPEANTRAHRKVLRPRYDLTTPQSKCVQVANGDGHRRGRSPVSRPRAIKADDGNPTARDSRSRLSPAQSSSAQPRRALSPERLA